MEIRCINAENYKLTVDKVYQAETDGRDFYKLLNDNNVGVRYHKRLFEATGNTRPAAPARPTPPPPPPPRTEADLVASITVRDGHVVFTDFDRTEKRVANQFSGTGSAISCGAIQVIGINGQIQTIDVLFELTEDDFITIRKALFKKCIEQYVQRNIARAQAFALLSTNTSGRDNGHEADEDMLSVLDEVAEVNTASRENPNSRRQIKVWVLQGIA
jgi:hypothetical protein